MRKSLFFTLFLLTATVGKAQIGGLKSFEFLNTPNNARLAALGGVNASLADRDLNFFFYNPATAGDTLAGTASATYQFFVANTGQAAFAYSHHFKKLGTLNFGVQHLSYGTIQGYDASGMETGDFKSGETALTVGKSHQVSHFRLGANLKVIFSNIAGYRASAVAVDLGGVFVHPREQLTIGMVIRNAGVVLSEYSETSSTEMPFDVQVGATYKPEHMPLRFSLTAYNLVRRNITYYDPGGTADEPGGLDKVLRHFNLGTEILLHRNVNILVGYNYLAHQELKLEEGGGGAGVSFGFSARVRSFEFIISRQGYVAGKAAYGFTLSKDIDNMLKRR